MNRSAIVLVFASVVRITLALAALSASAQTGSSIALETGKTIEADLAPGRSYEYRLPLRQGQYAKLSFEQRTVQAVYTILRPSRQPLYEVFNVPVGETGGAELVANVSGDWILTVAAVDSKAAEGKFAVTLQELAEASAHHRDRVAGIELVARAVSALKGSEREAFLKAIDLYEQSLPHWRRTGDKESEAITLYSIARTCADAGDKDKALRYANEALTAARASGVDGAVAWSLHTLGSIAHAYGDRRKAIEYLQQALPLMRKAGNRTGEAETLNALAIGHRGTGDVRGSLDDLLQAEPILTSLRDRRKLATLYSNIGVVYSDLGEYDKALENHQRALDHGQGIGNRSSQAVTWNNIGSVYSSMAEYQKALDAYRGALDIQRELGREWNVAVCLHNIAWVHATLGDRKQAEAIYREALAILRKIKDQPAMSNTLNNLGETVAALGQRQQALDYHNEALALRRAVGDRAGEALSLGNLGKLQAEMGQRDAARESLDSAQKILRTTGNPRRLSGTLLSSAALWRKMRQFDKASQELDEALSIGRQIRDRRTEADTLAEWARLEQDRGNVDAALARTSEALAALEELRLNIASPSLRAWLFAAKRDVQEMEVALLMRKHAGNPGAGFHAKALLAAERGKARSLLELLGESSAGIRRGAGPTLLARERELQRRIFATAERQTRQLNGKSTPAADAAAARELTSLTAEFEHLQSKIRSTSPEYAALTRPEPLRLDEIQQRVLDPGTALLEFALGEEKSYLWAVTATSFHAYTLPPRSEIEIGARRVHELLTARNRNPANESPAARAARVRQSDADFLPAAASISRMLLGQAAPDLQGKRLLIVADGALQYLPFSALPDPLDTSAKPAPLMLNHEIVNAPSASVVAALRHTLESRKPGQKALAIFADPVFSATDMRVPGSRQTRDDAGMPELLRLRFSRNEAEEIARLTPPQDTWKALDFDATRDAVLGDELAQYRIVHFATHAVLDNEHPELSSVVLSRVDRSGQPRNGYLRLYDVYNLRLGADLVVLSACETALGGEVNGEGLIGLTRGFLYAGSPRVVATLWKVDDRATSEIMKRFYTALLGHRDRPAAALRAAQTEMWKQKGWDRPYHWAAFTLQGEWR
ncbi:MAG: CHAT domain-containing tetratricopeptide repeat protein [Bryobacteraceae bacterium]